MGLSSLYDIIIKFYGYLPFIIKLITDTHTHNRAFGHLCRYKPITVL